MTEPENQLPSRRIAAHLRASIASGKYEPGDMIPSERTLAAAYGCARNTVRDAVRILHGEGLVTAKQGYGVIVLPVPPAVVEPLSGDEPEHLREWRVVMTATAVVEVRVIADNYQQAASRAVVMTGTAATQRSVTIGEWLVDEMTPVPGRAKTLPPTT